MLLEPSAPRIFTARAIGVILLSAIFLMPLAGCDLAKNQLKVDRSSDMEVQDYRDALASRLPDISDEQEDEASIPNMKPYMATPTGNLKPMPLVSISVNNTVPLRDALYEVAEQAGYDIELDPRIKGSVIFSARNRPFDQVIERIASSAGLRYKFDGDSVRVELDTPYHEIYKISYLNYIRANASSISNDVSVVSGGGADTGSKFKAEAKSESDFWLELNENLTQILGVNREAGNLTTKKDPRVTAATEEAAPVAPVAPVLLGADGEVTDAGGTAPVAAPNTVLRVEPLAMEEEEEQNSSDEDPFMPRFSLNKQAGIITVFANENLQKQVAKYLDILRASATSQVLIEAKVLEVSLNDEFSAGIDWSAIGLFNGKMTLGAFTDTSGNLAPLMDPAPDPSVSFFGRYASGDFSSAIEAMSRFGTVRALASPRLTVLNNQSAVLNVAKNQVYFELDLSVTEGTDSTPPRIVVDSNIRNVPEGVLINVQPSIDIENQVISMAVRPTVTRIVEYVNDPSVPLTLSTQGVEADIESPVPVMNVQEFDSVLQMNNGQAVVMGGLIQDRAQSTQTGVPVLSELPVMGALFRNQADKIQKTELVVFLKATIVEGNNTIHNTDKDLYRSFSQDRRPEKL